MKLVSGSSMSAWEVPQPWEWPVCGCIPGCPKYRTNRIGRFGISNCANRRFAMSPSR
jgi:hypothetical protein